MAELYQLPKPHVSARLFGARRLSVLTDDALYEQTGVRIAFTSRAGGVSEGAYASLNVGGHVGDSAHMPAQNRAILLESLGAPEAQLVMPNQVHGDNIVSLLENSPASVLAAQESALAGADGLLVDAIGVAALLCFADCVPVVLVSPSGCFAVVHAGWRGALAGIVGKAARALAERDMVKSGLSFDKSVSGMNAYIGPHIHPECFETGEEVSAQFAIRFGKAVTPDERHVNLAAVIGANLAEVGVAPSRIADVGICTVCNAKDYFSYRASGGTCGRHGALALRLEG